VVAPASTAYDRDYADPEVRFESESTHRGEFGTKRDLVSVWVATPRHWYYSLRTRCTCTARVRPARELIDA
jgi:hypothetical protein